VIDVSEVFSARLHEAGFKPFDKDDWYGFAGCESKSPWIRQGDEDGPTIILDGTTVCSVILADPEATKALSKEFNVEFADLTDAVNFAILLSKQNSSCII
jgi:hypothetical protein